VAVARGRRARSFPDDAAAAIDLREHLLVRAAALARPGGRVVYATCSVLREENDAVVDDVLAAGAPLEISSRRLLLPHEGGGDGFFVAVLRRTLGTARSPATTSVWSAIVEMTGYGVASSNSASVR
jgi:16S rRNA C967 or C1407 C5-methylase (RsmB/RsmF family)